MEIRPPLNLAQQYAAALDWWRDAGVDQDFHDEPEKLLKDPEAAKAAAAPQKRAPKPEPEKPKIGGDRAAWPQSLEAFGQWWTQEASLDEAGNANRVLPRGTQGAELMVIVPMPEADDRDTLLGAAQGKLVANMLKAMEIGEDAAYLASALPRHMPLADWDNLQAAGMGDVLLHHITLAAPKRLLVLGRDILPLLGQEKRQGVCELAVNDTAIQLLASFNPENLLENSRLRADLWRRWLDWTGKA